MALKIDTYNEKVEGWGTAAAKTMQATGSGMGITHRSNSPSPGASLPKVKSRYKRSGGFINVVTINVPRHLIYVHKGAGKGRGGTKGSRWTDKYGNTKKTNPKSFGKMGTAGRVEKPFINQVLDGATGVNQLADIVAIETGEIITANILVK